MVTLVVGFESRLSRSQKTCAKWLNLTFIGCLFGPNQILLDYFSLIGCLVPYSNLYTWLGDLVTLHFKINTRENHAMHGDSSVGSSAFDSSTVLDNNSYSSVQISCDFHKSNLVAQIWWHHYPACQGQTTPINYRPPTQQSILLCFREHLVITLYFKLHKIDFSIIFRASVIYGAHSITGHRMHWKNDHVRWHLTS